MNSVALVRFILFCGGSLFFVWQSSSAFIDISSEWNPISFYKVFTNPVPRNYLLLIKYLWLGFSFIAGLGIYFRFFAIAGFLFGMFFLGHEYNYNQIYHATHLYILSIGFFAVFGQTELTLKLIRYYVVYVLFLCGLQKLYYGGGLSWVFSDNFYIKIFLNPKQTAVGSWVLEQSSWVSQLMAFFALFVVELTAPFALYFYNKKSDFVYIFIIIWLSFHIMVTLTFGGHIQFFSQILCYTAFIKWEKFTLFNFCRANINST